MYVSGVIVAFILSLIVLGIQAGQRKKNNESSESSELLGVVLGSAVYSILSWLTVAIMIIMLIGGKVRWISEDNL